MKPEILYVELKQGHSGPAWIGYGTFSKSGSTVYFDGKVLKKAQGINSNHFDIETGEEYWISGVKKNGADRHWAGSGKVHIDKSAIDDYLQIVDWTSLPKNSFIIVELDNVPNKILSNEIENSKLTEGRFDNDLLYKKTPKDLTDEELLLVIAYYNNIDLPELPLKSRKGFISAMKELTKELEFRNKD